MIAPAIRLAEDGFTISPRLNGLLGQDKYLRNDPLARAYFFQADGSPKPVGTVLKNPAFARTLREIAERGADAFYGGDIAADIVATVTRHTTNPGDMTLEDLKNYKVEEREPVCGAYRSYRICGMGPPSSGGIAVQQILSTLETQDMAAHEAWAGGGALDGRGRPPRLCRPGALSRRSSLRRRAGPRASRSRAI